MKKFPVEEVNSETGDIKGEARFKDHKDSGLLKISADNASSDPNATITQKGKGNEAMMTEKHHYTIKLTNANKKAAEGGTGQIVNDESATTTQKKHVANIKWTPGMAAKDSTTTPTPTKMTTTSKEASTTEVHEYLKRTK